MQLKRAPSAAQAPSPNQPPQMDKKKTRIERHFGQNLNPNSTSALSNHAIVQFEQQSKSRKQSKEYRKLQTQNASTETQRLRDTESHRHRDTETQRHKDAKTQRHRDTGTQGHRFTQTQEHRDKETPRHRNTETDSGKLGSDRLRQTQTNSHRLRQIQTDSYRFTQTQTDSGRFRQNQTNADRIRHT